MKIGLSIAGSDSSGGAGIQGDLKTLQSLGVFGISVVTAVTVQNSQKVFSIQEISSKIVRDQILCLFEDFNIDVVKIGMVSNSKLIFTIVDVLKSVASCPIVLDPVMISKSNYSLLRFESRKVLIDNLLPISSVITPNLYEAEIIVGFKIDSITKMELAAKKIYSMGAKNVIIKGGHFKNINSIDVVFDGNKINFLKTRRINTQNTHGTGCTFSSAIAAYIAKGYNFLISSKLAKKYITNAILNSLNIGKGFGPLNHFFNLYNKAKLKY